MTFKRGAILGLVWLGGVAAGGLALHVVGDGDAPATGTAAEPGARFGLTEPVRVLPPAERSEAADQGDTAKGDTDNSADSSADGVATDEKSAVDGGRGVSDGSSRPAISNDDLVPGALSDGDGDGASAGDDLDATGAAEATAAPAEIEIAGDEPTDAEATRIRAEAERLGDRAAELIERQTAAPIQSLSASLGELRGIVGSIGGLRTRLKELKPSDGLDEHAERLDGLASEMQGLQQTSIDLHKRLIEVFKESIAPVPEDEQTAAADASDEEKTDAGGGDAENASARESARKSARELADKSEPGSSPDR